MNPYPPEKVIAALENRLSTAEQKQLDDWIAQSEENRSYFDELKKVHQFSEKARSRFNPNALVALQNVNRRIRMRRIVRWSASSAAAIFVLLFALKVVFFTEPDWQSIYANQRQVCFLPDSSKVILAPDAKLHFPESFSGNSRNVKLEGRAYFEVKRNPDRPFIISTPNNKIKVLGTRFLVDASTLKTEKVWVDQGKVAFYKNETELTDQLILTAQECGTWNAKTKEFREEKFDDTNKNTWLSGRLTFVNTPAKNVFTTLEKYFQIEINTERLDQNPLYTGSFKVNDSPERILQIVCASLNISIAKNTNQYIINP